MSHYCDWKAIDTEKAQCALNKGGKLFNFPLRPATAKHGCQILGSLSRSCGDSLMSGSERPCTAIPIWLIPKNMAERMKALLWNKKISALATIALTGTCLAADRASIEAQRWVQFGNNPDAHWDLLSIKRNPGGRIFYDLRMRDRQGFALFTEEISCPSRIKRTVKVAYFDFSGELEDEDVAIKEWESYTQRSEGGKLIEQICSNF